MYQTQYIKAGWLIDGSGGPIQKNVLLKITNGIITDIKSLQDSPAPDPNLVTDLSHCTILPPLVDSHVHLALSSTVDDHARQKQLTAPYEEIHNQIVQNIHYHFTHGILGLCDGGDGQGHVLRYKGELSTKNRVPVILKTPGYAWHKKVHYGKGLGRHPGENELLVDAVARETESADCIKIINSGPNSFSDSGKEPQPLFSPDELREIVHLAEQQGKKVMVLANGEVPVRHALEAGCDAIEQGYGMGEDNLRNMAKKGVLWIPNVLRAKNGLDSSITEEGVGCRFSTRYVAQGKPVPGAEAFWKKLLAEQLTQLSFARKLGVTAATGTGAGSAGILHGESMVEEMKLFITAGYSLEETIRCASENGAGFFGMENLGTLTVGRKATFLVVRGTPAQIPRKLSFLEGIYLNGTPCSKKFFEKV